MFIPVPLTVTRLAGRPPDSLASRSALHFADRRQDAVLLEVGDRASRDRGDPWGGDVIELRRLWHDLVPRRHDRRTHAVESQRALVGRQDRARRAGAFGVGDHDLHLAHVVGGVLTCVHARCRKRCARLGRIGRWREGDLVGRLDREARHRHPAEADLRSAGEPRAVDRDRRRRRFQTGVGADARHARDRRLGPRSRPRTRTPTSHSGSSTPRSSTSRLPLPDRPPWSASRPATSWRPGGRSR